MRVGSLRLVLRVVLPRARGVSLAVRRRTGRSLTDYRCCFRIDALMTGRLDTVYDDLPGKPSDDERASFTFMTSELLVYTFTGGRPAPAPRVRAPRRAVAADRRSGRRVRRWPRDDAHRWARRVRRRGLEPRVHERAEPDEPHVQGRARTPSQSRGRASSRRHRRKGTGRVTRRNTASEQAHSTGSVRAGRRHTCSSRPRELSSRRFKTKKLSRVRSFGKDVKHNPILSTLIPHKTTGFVRVEVCIRHVTPQRVRPRRAKIRALVGKEPTRVTSLRCSLGRRHDPHASVEGEVAVLHEVRGRRHPQLDRPCSCAVERSGEPRRHTGVVPGDRHTARCAVQHVRVRDPRSPRRHRLRKQGRGRLLPRRARLLAVPALPPITIPPAPSRIEYSSLFGASSFHVVTTVCPRPEESRSTKRTECSARNVRVARERNAAPGLRGPRPRQRKRDRAGAPAPAMLTAKRVGERTGSCVV